VLLNQPAILMLEHPLAVLRGAQRQALLTWLRDHRGTTTTLVISDDPELMSAADRLVLLRAGALAFQGRPADLLSRSTSA